MAAEGDAARLSYLARAEEWSREHRGRGMTADELEARRERSPR
jgi:hypothetical protein